MVEVRELTVDDWTTWRVLRQAALAEAPHAFGTRLADWQGDGDRPERWRARLSIPNSRNLAAVLDDEPVGMASGVPTEDAGSVELISMWIRPEARGRGVGDALVSSIVRWAGELGARTVRLRVAEGNEPAAELYRRHGFRYTGEIAGMMPDGNRRELVMAVTLGRA